MNLKYLVLCSLIVASQGCKSTQNQPEKPSANYQPVEQELAVSTVNIPISIDLKTLENTINSSINGIVYEDNSYTNNNNDGLKVTATKTQNITLRFDDKNNIYYRVPLKLWIAKDIMVSELVGEGELALNFKTTYAIKPNWALQTATSVENFSWIKSPAIKTGLGSIPVEYIANLVLNRSKNELSKSIDDELNKGFDLKKYVEKAWNLLQEPILLDEQYKMWLQIQPQSLQIAPLRSNATSVMATVMAQGKSVVNFGDKPYFKANSSLPNCAMVPAPKLNNYQIALAAEIPYAEAERLAKKSLVNQSFSSGKKNVVIKDIQLYGRFDKLVINTTLAGSYNGNIYFTGKPIYNAQTNSVELTEFDFDLATKNYMIKSMDWLAHKGILQAMKKQLVFPLDQNLNQAQKLLQQELNNFELTKGVFLMAKIATFQIDKTYLTPQAIKVVLNSTGNLNMRLINF